MLPPGEEQRHECPAPAHLLLAAAIIVVSVLREGGNQVVGAVTAQIHKIGMKLLHRPLLLANAAHLAFQPNRQPFRERAELAQRNGRLEPWCRSAPSQIYTDHMALKPDTSRNLAD